MIVPSRWSNSKDTELESILSNIEDIIHITPFSTEEIEDDISAAEKKEQILSPQ